MEKKIHADWLSQPLVKRVLEVLGAADLRFVGGAVRDTVLGRTVQDIDAACRHLPQTTIHLLQEAGVKTVPTGMEHGTVTAVLDGQSIEITTLRSDVETDGRHAKVAFTDDWLEDAARRDFTFNALYLSSNGDLYDPFDGISDLQAGRVRFIGDAETRIREDALRIMRFFRFHAWYGKGPLDHEGVIACKRNVALLTTLSVERIRSELLKMLAAPDPLVSIEAFVETGGDGVLEFGTTNADLLKFYLSQEQKHNILPDPLLRLVCWLSVGQTGMKGFARDYRFSNKERERLCAAAKGLEASAPSSQREMRSLYYRLGREAAQVCIMTQGDDADGSLVEILKGWQPPSLPVRGGDLIACGEQEGPGISRKLKYLESIWIDSDFQRSKDSLLSEL